MNDDLLFNINEGNSGYEEDVAIASLALGIISILGIPFFIGWLGLFGVYMSIVTIKADRNNKKNLKCGIYGLMTSLIAVIVTIVLLSLNFNFINLAGW